MIIGLGLVNGRRRNDRAQRAEDNPEALKALIQRTSETPGPTGEPCKTGSALKKGGLATRCEREFVPLRVWWHLCRLCVFGLFLMLFKGRAIGLRRVPRRGRVILACNHQSFFDPPLVTVLLNREASYLARDTLFSSRLFGGLIRSLNAIPLRRDQADVTALKEMLRRLRAGYIVVTFPEGTRTTDGSVSPMRPGTVLLAQRAKAAIVPVCIDGAYEAWPRNRFLPWLGRVTVMYGEPIQPDEMVGRDAEEIICELRHRIVEMQRHLRCVAGKRSIAYDPLETSRK